MPRWTGWLKPRHLPFAIGAALLAVSWVIVWWNLTVAQLAPRLTILPRISTLPGVAQVLGRGDTKASVIVNVGTASRPVHINADLRVVSDEQYPFTLHYFTGSKEHCIAMRVRAQQHGLKLNEYGLTGPKGPIPCKTETDFFAALGLDYIPPELREDSGEIEAAAAHTLPKLVEVRDIRGVFHNHTTASDGGASLEEMAEAAQAIGFQYLGIADHSQSLTVARGLTPDRVRAQQKQIDALNEAGLHRTPWDMREAAPQGQGGGGRGAGGRGGQPPAGDNAEPPSEEQLAQQQAGRGGAGRGGAGGGAGAAGGGGGGGGGFGGRGGRGGPLVKPGTYTVQLGKLANGTVTPLGEARKVEVIPLKPSNR